MKIVCRPINCKYYSSYNNFLKRIKITKFYFIIEHKSGKYLNNSMDAYCYY